ncbi:hypothetical protein [Microbacterium sp. MYb66]|uniref:hypothetical protein n=1 Tax=Microbacterium sp. MYb66 TaxID=1848692 RepID=UPI0011B0311B|nr:hypothetical protein [Microbacterium sp. MYb66]
MGAKEQTMIPRAIPHLYLWRIVVFTMGDRTEWVPTLVLEPKEWMMLQTSDGEARNTWVASLLGAGFGLVIDPDLARIAHDAPVVAPTAAMADVGRDGAARIGGSLAESVWTIDIEAPIDTHDPETAAIRRLIASRRTILMITGSGLQINESTWALDGLSSAVEAGTVVAGWIPVSEGSLR